MSQFYYADGKERFGPYTLEELKSMNINQETRVWTEGWVAWVPARNLSDLQSLFSMTPEASMPVPTPYSSPMIEAPPKNWLVESVLITLLCCLPLGIVGIIHATKVESLWNSGQRDAAIKASKEAAKWVKLGLILGIIGIALYIILLVFGVLAGIGSGIEM